jgi:hypothetical protein
VRHRRGAHPEGVAGRPFRLCSIWLSFLPVHSHHP